MGVRVYLPTLGRFTQVDPIEGGVENNYVYPPDPINDFDLTGECVGCLVRGVNILKAGGKYTWQGVRWTGGKAKTFTKSVSPLHAKEFNFGNRIRIKPLGYWKGKTIYEKLPHYHRRGPGGIGHHHPWQPYNKNGPHANKQLWKRF